MSKTVYFSSGFTEVFRKIVITRSLHTHDTIVFSILAKLINLDKYLINLFPKIVNNFLKHFCKKLQSWTKGCRQIHKIKQNKFLYGMFYDFKWNVLQLICHDFFKKTSIFGLQVIGWVLLIKSKHFRVFLEIS